MKKIASHNTMSYLPVKQWYLKPFYWMARCQSKSIFRQYDEGCRFFDIRLTLDKNDKLVFAHGLITYKASAVGLLYNFHNYIQEPVHIRLVFEITRKDTFKEPRLVKEVATLEYLFDKFLFNTGRRKYDWQPIYCCKDKEYSLDQKVSSMQGTKIDDLCPWLYAKLHNKQSIKEGTDKDFLMLDFI